MDSKKKLNIWEMEEDKVNQVAFIFASLAAIGAWAMVRGFLGGPPRDNLILIDITVLNILDCHL